MAMDVSCSKCGGGVGRDGRCTTCGHNQYVDLEIAAFQAPHIKRSRIALVLVGALYVYLGYEAYSMIAPLRRALAEQSQRHAGLDKLTSAVQLAYVLVIATLVAGIANIVLAVIAGKKTMLAFNLAAGVFVVLTCLQVYASEGVVFTSVLWWVSAIFLAMGYQAARKAESLRRGA